MIVPIILAGGTGSRLWPASRGLYPKQFLNLLDEELSLFQQTILRTQTIKGVADPVIICNEEHRFLVAEQLRTINTNAKAIILEPIGRNTAPAIALAALANNNDSDTLLILPADHQIQNTQVFTEAVIQAESLSKAELLVLFGITTSGPETGYGYIEKGPKLPNFEYGYSVSKFLEKPNYENAVILHQSNDTYWNSGMFLFKQSSFLGALQQFAPDVFTHCSNAYRSAETDLDFIRIQHEDFVQCPDISIDYAIMEHSTSSAVIPIDAGWSDVGAWESLLQASEQDASGNSIKGDVLSINTQNSLVHANSRLVATLGLKDHIVVETADAVLVASKDHSQQVKSIVKLLADDGRAEHNEHKRVYRPWGWYESISVGERFQVKRILVNVGASLSLQKHLHRAEHWVVVKGVAIVTNGDEVKSYSVDESTYIPIGNQHRLENKGDIPLEIIEIQTGEYLGEDDIIRIEDVYGRTK